MQTGKPANRLKMMVPANRRLAAVSIWKKLTKEKIHAYSAIGCGMPSGWGMVAKTGTMRRMKRPPPAEKADRGDDGGFEHDAGIGRNRPHSGTV
ncbi:MAG: hypothetical protein RIM72_20590 [Alphaproteobacteria bacterium]